MSRSRYERIREAFLSVSSLDEEARARALDDLPPDLRDDVIKLLAGARTQGILDRPTALPTDAAPERIGPYRVTSRIGQGGMGDVYLASQEGALDRRVAVKRIPSGSRFVERFETERRVLARLRHPHIAVVYDAGDDGQHSWLAMEYIDGPPVDAWCRDHAPDLRARVDLVLQICAGLAHAHGRGVLHRDLKPSNLLVETVDGRPVVRIIDFGVAKVLQDLDGVAPGATLAGQLLGTPGYMAPEQTELQPELVDVRSDLYAAGVVLYELISGHLPHPPELVAGKGLTELRERLLNHDPPPPSRHRPGVDRELDWICARALARDPDERYQTAREFADDLQRWLDGRAVLAAPPGAAYRARKFVRRHRLAFGAGVAVLAAVVLGLLGTSLALVRAREAEAVARAESQRSRQTTEFLLDLFDDADPSLGGARDEIAEWVVRRGRASLDLLDDPQLRRSFAATIGRLYHVLGLYAEAEPLLAEALAAADAEGPLALAAAHHQVAMNEYDLGRYDRADSLLQAAEAAVIEAGDAPGAATLNADIVSWRGTVAIRLNDPDRGLELMAASNEMLEALQPYPWRRLADNQQSISVALRHRERFDEALAASDRGLSILREAGAERTPLYAAGLHSRANLLGDMERRDEALADFELSRSIYVAAFGPDHPLVAASYSNQSVVHYYLGDYEKMEEMTTLALAIQEKLTSRDDPSLAQHLVNRSVARLSRGSFDGVEADLVRARDIYIEAFGGEHPHVASVLDNLAYLYQEQGRQDEALATYKACADMRVATLGATHRRTLLSRLKYAEALAAAGRRDEARALATEILPAVEEARGPEHDHTVRTRALLAGN